MGNKVYSIKQVAAMLGIPTVTLRAWENRYSAVTPERTESGYRMYTEENVADLRWLKEQVELHQTNISEAVRMLKVNKFKSARGCAHADHGSSAYDGRSLRTHGRSDL